MYITGPLGTVHGLENYGFATCFTLSAYMLPRKRYLRYATDAILFNMFFHKILFSVVAINSLSLTCHVYYLHQVFERSLLCTFSTFDEVYAYILLLVTFLLYYMFGMLIVQLYSACLQRTECNREKMHEAQPNVVSKHNRNLQQTTKHQDTMEA